MNYDKKKAIAEKTDRKTMFRRLCNGVVEAATNPVKGVLLLLYIVGLVVGWQFRDELFLYEDVPFLAKMLHDITLWSVMFAVAMGLLMLLVCLGTPLGAKSARDNLLRAGLTNGAGETPILLSKKMDKKTGIVKWKFDPLGIHRKVWEEKQNALEAALNISIISIYAKDGKRTIVIEAVPAKGDLPDFVLWRDSLLSPDNFKLLLGVGLAGQPVTIDLTATPHFLIGGETGCGKSILLKCLLRQAHMKKARLFIADKKRGLDYPRNWRTLCRMAFDDDSILEMLTDLVQEMERRLDILDAAGCPNMDTYNSQTGSNLPRIIFACDEVAELLDKTGRTKEHKEKIDKISACLETLARESRACNISLILATQRPDAQTIPPQVKSNLGGRIGGKCSQVLSQIILDSTDAATMIPKDSRGRFLYGDILFQAYWMNEEDL